MGRMSDMDIALHEGYPLDEEEARIYESLSQDFAKLASLKRKKKDPSDKLTDTYETDESLDAKSGKAEEEAEEAKPKSVQIDLFETSKPQITLVEVRKRLADLSRGGHTAEVRALIVKYGADKLSAVKEEDYPALMKDAEGIANGSK